ncbi:hypothetical protein [Pelagovum pacificum]|uniref:Uncharacterized protein n=1 Tax=Pelagovum pacificum TaxID=2588711 RepID=A0A5C5GDS6_9RHOB|nr:hypothetical protein [Pelagovum pacificum]QQA44781.1 hypothetical protein I8N54_09510 [Pelagovum pacificum]TNY32111.1 hypothetical protein FHY64_02085 [Pelagovum pacificum]
MEWREVSSNWTAFVPSVLTRWPAIEEEEALDVDGDRARLTTLVANRMAMSQAVADGEVTDWLMGMAPADTMMDESLDNARISASAADIPPGEDVYSEDAEFGDDNEADPPVGRTG